jgi:hypothetical protein
LDRVGFFSEGVNEEGEEVVCVVDFVGVFADNPDQGGFGFWFV